MLLHRGRAKQLTFDFGFGAEDKAMEVRWQDAEEGEKRSRARFAQNAIKPEEVAPEWRRWRDVLGGPEEVRSFVDRAMRRLETPLQNARNGAVDAHLQALPDGLRERLANRGLTGTVRLSFDDAALCGQAVTRSHPLTATLAETLLEGALDPASADMLPLGRAGAWPTKAVTTVTTVLLLRLRFKLTIQSRRERLLLAEEAQAVGLTSGVLSATGDAARALLEAHAAGDLAEPARQRALVRALEGLDAALAGPIAQYARERAEALADDHERVRSADGRRAAGTGGSRVTVEPVLPADVIGLYVLLPEL